MRSAWLRLFVLLAIALAALTSVVATSQRLEAPPRQPFDARPLREIRRVQPDFVLIGNSMVNTRFHEKTLRELLAPRTVVKVANGGSKSSAWYLYLKNYVVASGVRPRRVIFFFLDHDLTRPHDRTVGPDARQLTRASPTDDPVVEAKLAPGLGQPIARLGWHLERAAPVARLRALAADPLDRIALKLSSLFQPGLDRESRMAGINALFELGELNQAAEPTATSAPDVQVFSEVVEQSFLPDILALARQHGIPLAFVRVRTIDAARGEAESAALTRYVDELRAYLQADGAMYVDMKSAEWEHAGLYGSGNHIARPHLRRYTRLFVKNVPQVFQ